MWHTHVGTCNVYLSTSALGFQWAGAEAPVQKDVLLLCINKACGHVCSLQEQTLEWLHRVVGGAVCGTRSTAAQEVPDREKLTYHLYFPALAVPLLPSAPSPQPPFAPPSLMI